MKCPVALYQVTIAVFVGVEYTCHEHIGQHFSKITVSFATVNLYVMKTDQLSY